MIIVSNTSASFAYDLSAGWFNTCAIDDNGAICWGDNWANQSTIPGGLGNPTTLATGPYHSCAIDDAGVSCWGSPSFELFERGQANVPDGLINPTAITAGRYHTCAIADGVVHC
jgi:hypothetical protein